MSSRTRGEWPNYILHRACRNGRLKEVERLLEEGYSSNALNKDGAAPLHCAVEAKRINITRLLLFHEANINQSTSVGETPLHLACRRGFNSITLLLLRRDAAVNAWSRNFTTPLHHACMHCSLRTVRKMVDAGADLDAYSTVFCSPVHIAIVEQREDLLRFLVSKGAPVNIMDANVGDYPIHMVCSTNCRRDMLPVLVDGGGASVDMLTYLRQTPLMLASRSNCLQSVSYLLEKGCDINLYDRYGSHALHYALEDAQVASIRILGKYSGARLHHFLDDHARNPISPLARTFLRWMASWRGGADDASLQNTVRKLEEFVLMGADVDKNRVNYLLKISCCLFRRQMISSDNHLALWQRIARLILYGSSKAPETLRLFESEILERLGNDSRRASLLNWIQFVKAETFNLERICRVVIRKLLTRFGDIRYHVNKLDCLPEIVQLSFKLEWLKLETQEKETPKF